MTHQLRGVLALLVVTLVWGTTFPAMKDLTATLSPAWIVFTRFAIAGALLSPFLWRAASANLKSGLMLGFLLFFCYVFQVEGLALTTSNRNAFICGLNVLIVPLLGIMGGRAPERRIVIALVLAVSGLAALCWDGGAWRFGDTLALGAALCFGLYIKMMEVRSRAAPDVRHRHPDRHGGRMLRGLAAGDRSAVGRRHPCPSVLGQRYRIARWRTVQYCLPWHPGHRRHHLAANCGDRAAARPMRRP